MVVDMVMMSPTLAKVRPSYPNHSNPAEQPGCTYRWFSTPEMCMVLERFTALVFVGDDISRAIYLAFNILLREDLAFGGLQNHLTDSERASCRCDNQFLDECEEVGIKSSDEELRRIERSRYVGSSYYCERRLLGTKPFDCRC